jgi:(1->4)-alpha-D-glucan 1-alpha-D-glucosylmutase
MAEAADALPALCERVGLALDYHDAMGHHHRVSRESLQALLAEFGIHEATPQALARLQSADRREPLPPIAVLEAGTPGWTVAARLPRWWPRLRWTLREEGGAEHHGEFDRAACTADLAAEPDDDSCAWRLTIAQALPAGYHRLSIDGVDGHVLLVAAPAHCWRPPALHGDGRVWGPALQLYALRSERNWGMGDFGDLAQVVEQWGERGAGIVGLNPLHALFPHNPAHASPYSPSSRLHLNVLYIDVEAVEDFRDCEAMQRLVRSAPFQARLARLRDAPQVDYVGVAGAKFEVLQGLYESFRERQLRAGGVRGAEFRAFQAERGETLRRHATFEALQAHFHAADPSIWGWPAWPAPCHDPGSPEVRRFVAENGERIEFFEYLQWQADRQLGRLSRHCRARGLAVGLYLDLAVSVDRAGSDTWGRTDLYALGASIGAPPDEFNPNGQGWGLPPMRPDSMRAERHAFFVQALRACMRYAGAVRIDHVMALMRLYWIAPGRSVADGAYVHYPMEELLAIVALESERNQCMVIGEDLGTVADEARVALARCAVLSYRLLYFERDADGGFKPPGDYPREALAAISTHDLATLAGWWSGHDLALRLALGLFTNARIHEAQRAARAQDRVRLLLALQQAALLAQDVPVDALAAAPLTPELAEAVHAYVATTPSRVTMVQLEDVQGVVDQANLPGTTDEHPNWRRKLPLPLEAQHTDARARSLASVLSRLRPHAPLRPLAEPRAEATVPRATYRLQFHKEFGFDDAVRVLPYLKRLGISHVYCSPIMRARSGSTHGYDVVAHDEINPELGGREGFERFTATLRAHGLGQLLDLVPNHMGVLGADNAWWMDVLEHGAASLYAGHFDIDWHPVNPDLEGKVLLPLLGDHYGAVLDSGQLRLVFEPERGGFALRYHEHRFPLDPRSYAAVLDHAAAPWPHEHVLAGLAAAFARLPPRGAAEPQAAAERLHDQALLKARLAALHSRYADARAALEAAVEAFNAADALDALHEAQAYRLSYWRVAADEINYRRFFDINELAALRMEDSAVFEATQGFALELAAAGLVDGLRIDHPDGLHDPAQYFERLQRGYARRAGLIVPPHEARGRPTRPLYVVAEKIVASHEDVPDTWAVHGTTGYRFANLVNGVLMDGAAREHFDRVWRRFTGETRAFEELAYEGKRAIMRGSLASELTVLATELRRIARAHRRTRDYTFNGLRDALAEVCACLPVYRTYIVERPSAQDERYIDWAVAQARQRSHAADTSVFDFVRETLLARAARGAQPALQQQVRRFAMRFQQFSAPVTAKGVEDTAFYRYGRLASLNEVGGDPATFGMTVRAFHGASADRAARWPHTIVATSTHDNKRSEDVRNRLDVLTEMPATWRLWLRRWSTMPQLERAQLDGISSPSRGDEYLLYQTLLGTLPAAGLDDESIGPYRERIERYALKAAREAKLHTSWINPNAAYEAGLAGFVHSMLARVRPNPLLGELQSSAQTLAWFGALNSLSMVLLKFTSPGVPDLYQGNELMDFSLVDPDNRRPVDYGLRAQCLGELAALAEGPDRSARLRALAEAPHDGRLKLWVTWRLLQLRAAMPALFRDGGYAALSAAGSREEHVLSYAREWEGRQVVVIAGRLFARLSSGSPLLPVGEAAWGDTVVELPAVADGTPLTEMLSGRTLHAQSGGVRIAQAFAVLPAAALVVGDKGVD